MQVKGYKNTGIIFIGPMGAGKDYVLKKIHNAFEDAYVDTFTWQVGDYYYQLLAKEKNVSIKHIYDNKPDYRSRLQEIGSTATHVACGVAFSMERYNVLSDFSIFPIVIGRRPDEALALKQQGAAVVFIYADEETRIRRIEKRDKRTPTKEQLNHPVEPQLCDFLEISDFILTNEDKDGTLKVKVDPDRGKILLSNKGCSGEINFAIK